MISTWSVWHAAGRSRLPRITQLAEHKAQNLALSGCFAPWKWLPPTAFGAESDSFLHFGKGLVFKNRRSESSFTPLWAFLSLHLPLTCFGPLHAPGVLLHHFLPTLWFSIAHSHLIHHSAPSYFFLIWKYCPITSKIVHTVEYATQLILWREPGNRGQQCLLSYPSSPASEILED